MPSRDDYLSFLNEFGLSEDKVLPILDIKKAPVEAVAMLLGALGNKNIQGDERKTLEMMANMMVEQTNTNVLLSKINETLTSDLSQINFDIQNKAYPGVFPTDSFNAQCVFKDKGFLILIDTGCFEVIEAAVWVLLSKWAQ